MANKAAARRRGVSVTTLREWVSRLLTPCDLVGARPTSRKNFACTLNWLPRRSRTQRLTRGCTAGGAGPVGFGLALSAIGLFGRVNRDVVARTQEIVIRSALGATPFQTANLFLRDTARILVLSGVLGIGAAVAAGRAIEGQIDGVSGTDLTMYVGAAATLALVATIATRLPLRRAWRAGESTHLLRM